MNAVERAAVTLALVMLCVAAGAAQPKKRPGRFKIGPLYVTPKVELKNAGVDTNVFNAQTAPISDTAVVLGPRLDSALPLGRRFRLTATGTADYHYYQQRKSERSADLYGNTRADFDVGPFTLFGALQGIRARQRFSLDIDDRVLRHERRATGGLKWTATQKISATASGTKGRFTIDEVLVRGEDIRDTLDRDSLTGTVELRYALTSKTTVLASLDTIEDRFLRQIGDTRRSVRSHRYLGGFELGERALVTGRVLAGIREFPASASQAAPPKRVTALVVDLATPLLRVGRLSGSIERDLLYAANQGLARDGRLRNLYASTRYRGQVSIDLPLSLVGRASAGYEEADYVLPIQQGSAPGVLRKDRLTTAGGSLLRSFGTGVRIGGTMTWTRRRSNIAGLSYEGARYGLQAEVVP